MPVAHSKQENAYRCLHGVNTPASLIEPYFHNRHRAKVWRFCGVLVSKAVFA
jgi:hypothetical protein